MALYIFNASTNVVGGGVQTAVNFILQTLSDKSNEWIYFTSKPVGQNLENIGHKLEQQIIIQETPARSLASRKILKQFVDSSDAKAILTLSGPAYVDFSIPHLMGISNAYLTHAPRKIIIGSGVVFWLRTLYRKRFVKLADRWFFQTESARSGFCEQYSIEKDKTEVISNSCSDFYLQNHTLKKRNSKTNGKVRILIPAADFHHKNLDIVPEVAYLIKKELPDRNVQFSFTLPESSNTWNRIKNRGVQLKISDQLVNRGPFLVQDGPSLYQEHDILFLPSKLETFSANYLEAMAMGLPIITSNLDFAHDVCKDSACYFDPDNPSDAAEQIRKIIVNPEEKEALVKKARKRLGQFPTINERYRLIVDQLEILTK